MEDTAKYLIHADFVADGVIERSDVVGAVFGQTEGLLGEDLDIRDLQQSSKLGRIDVEVESENGQSYGHLTIASSLDKVETAILAAALEAIDRIGPCRSRVEIARVEDVRAAKRREVVERAKELLATAFDESVMDSDEILDEVRDSVRVEDITEYEGLPAGPRVASSDAVIIVEGRSDVLTLLKYGIKNAIAVEGTNVPEAVAGLTEGRTVTAFLDSDRGGDLIRRELRQVGDVDYIARAPAEKSVEDLSRHEVDAALRNKVPVESFDEERAAATDGSVEPAPSVTDSEVPEPDQAPDLDGRTDEIEGSSTNGGSIEEADLNGANEATDLHGAAGSVTEPVDTETELVDTTTESIEAAADPGSAAAAAVEKPEEVEKSEEPAGAKEAEKAEEAAHVLSLADHVEGVTDGGIARLLSEDLDVIAEVDADEAFDAIESAEPVPTTVVVDAPVTQRIVDVAAQRGVARVIGTGEGEFVKQPASVRVHTADAF